MAAAALPLWKASGGHLAHSMAASEHYHFHKRLRETLRTTSPDLIARYAFAFPAFASKQLRAAVQF